MRKSTLLKSKAFLEEALENHKKSGNYLMEQSTRKKIKRIDEDLKALEESYD